MTRNLAAISTAKTRATAPALALQRIVTKKGYGEALVCQRCPKLAKPAGYLQRAGSPSLTPANPAVSALKLRLIVRSGKST